MGKRLTMLEALESNNTAEMSDLESRVERLQDPKVQDFIKYGLPSNPRPTSSIEPESAQLAPPPDRDALTSFSTRLPLWIIHGIKRAAFENKMAGKEPITAQGVLSEALTEYIKKHGW
jgi:hypothetical protein